MAKAAAGIPDQIRATLAATFDAALSARRFDEVVVVGSHPTSFALEMFEATLGAMSSVPVIGSAPDRLSGFVDADTLVVAVSVAGDDSRVVSSAEESAARGAAVVCVTSNGALEAFAKKTGAGLVALGDVPRSRAAVMAVFSAIGMVLERVGLLIGACEILDEAATEANARLSGPVAYESLHDEVAHRIGRTFPFVVGASGVGAAAAKWWASEIAANARTLGFASSVPELFSDTIAAFGQSGDVTRQVLTLVLLRCEAEPRGSDEAFAALDDQLLEVVADVVSVDARGSTPTAELVDLVVVGELVSLRLAAAEEIDPGPAPAIDERANGAWAAGAPA